ncbi:MAG: hypothetical protein ACXW1C_06165 [Gallionella sp.]
MFCKKIILLLGAAGLLVSCGGGGGGTNNPPPNYPTLTPSGYANPAAGEFVTLPPYTTLPTDATCAASVRAASKVEIRPSNAAYNAAVGKALPNFFNGSVFDAKVVHSNTVTAAHISGNFTGTSEDILRWGACKWGIDENVVKAMAANESQWQQAHRFNATNLPAAQAAASAVGNTLTYHPSTTCNTNTMPGASVPPSALPAGTVASCSRDWGILQVNYEQYPSAWPEAEASTAMNVDVVLAIVRACYDGDETWITTKPLPTGATAYAAGNLAYCVGRYNSGLWYDANAQIYVSRIDKELVNKTWLQATFKNLAWAYP